MTKHNCPELLGDLSDYLDGNLPRTLCDEIEQHMATCEDCRVVVDTLRQTVELYQTLPQPDLPAHLRERLYKTFNLDGAKPPLAPED